MLITKSVINIRRNITIRDHMILKQELEITESVNDDDDDD